MKSALVAISLAMAANAPAHAQSIGQASYFQYSRYAGLYAAHRTFPVGTHVKVVNLGNGRSATVVIVGRGPFIGGRIIDVSTSAADLLGFRQAGVARVKLEIVDR